MIGDLEAIKNFKRLLKRKAWNVPTDRVAEERVSSSASTCFLTKAQISLWKCEVVQPFELLFVIRELLEPMSMSDKRKGQRGAREQHQPQSQAGPHKRRFTNYPAAHGGSKAPMHQALPMPFSHRGPAFLIPCPRKQLPIHWCKFPRMDLARVADLEKRQMAALRRRGAIWQQHFVESQTHTHTHPRCQVLSITRNGICYAGYACFIICLVEEAFAAVTTKPAVKFCGSARMCPNLPAPRHSSHFPPLVLSASLSCMP